MIQAAPTTIVSLLPAATEIVCALGAGERLVGRSHECDFPDWVARLPACTAPRIATDGTSGEIDRAVRDVMANALSIYDVDMARLTELAPDVVVTQDQCEVCAVALDDVAAALRDGGLGEVSLVSLTAQDLDGVWRDIARTASALGREEAGIALVGACQARLDAVRAAAERRGRRPTVACLEWLDPLMAAGNWVPELCAVAGADDCFGASGAASHWIEWSDLAAADPEIVVLMPCGFDMARTRREMAALAREPRWAQLSAVRAGRIFVTDGNQYFNRPGPRLADSAEILAEIVTPDVVPARHRGIGWAHG